MAAPEIPVGTHFFRQRYLYAFATQAEVLHHIRTNATEEDVSRLPEILRRWEELQPKVRDLINAEGGLPDRIGLTSIPEENKEQVESYASDPLFKKTFSNLPISHGIVDASKLVAPQRTVNLDYVDRLLEKCPKRPTTEDLLEICLSPTRDMDPIQHLEVAPNTHVFSSPNSDIRFLGAYVKHLTSEDLDYAVMGGLPAAAVIAFVGYGGAPVNVLKAGNRVALNNGFHRVYALYSLGIHQVPVVVQHVRNVQLEFPPQMVGLPREYVLNTPRPVLVKDFFEADFSMDVRAKERVKTVTLAITPGQHEIPS